MSKEVCIKEAQTWVEMKALYLDTETTGLGEKDQIVQIAIVDHTGKVLMDTLVKPTIPIPLAATAIHGIRQVDVAGSPTWKDIWQRVKGLIADRTVVIYNKSYDMQMMRQSCEAHGIDWYAEMMGHTGYIFCAMLTYAEFYGEWNEYRHDYKWQRLEVACHQQGIETSDITAHRAAGDCEMTRRLVRKMAMSELEVTP